jgi:dTDP-4-dehydrorhamnose 3,5-epimerase
VLIAATPIPGVFRMDIEPITDERGFFARLSCSEELAQHGLVGGFAQTSLSSNTVAGTVRGMHFQKAPHAETKIVRCVSGAILDAVFDLRPHSPTYLEHFAVELNEINKTALYIPPGIAHGFQTLRDASEVLYMIDKAHHAESASGVRWDDPQFNFGWPMHVSVIAERDRSFPDWRA